MNTSMNLQRISVDRLKPAKYNPRKDLKPGDPAYEKIKRSLHEFGYVDPVIWNEVTGNIVGGHQRYKVLVAEGATEIDCVVVHIENPQEEKALNIALNKAVGEWEPVALADLLNDLKLSGYDVDATGFDAAEVDALFSQVHDKDVKEDDFDVGAELKQPCFSRMGDVWHLGRHTVICGDTTLPETFERLLGDARVNLVCTDAPYFVALKNKSGTIANDDLNDKQAYEFLIKCFTNFKNAMAKDASIYEFYATMKTRVFYDAFEDAGFKVGAGLVWKKPRAPLMRTDWKFNMEPIIWGWRKDGKPALLADLQALSAGMDEGALTEYLSLMTQIQSLLDSGMSEAEVQALFPDIDFSSQLDQFAGIVSYLDLIKTDLPGLYSMFGEALPEEVLKIATDLDMTGAQARWDEFARNPGAITTEAIITGLSTGDQQVNVDAFISSYTEVPEGASTAALTPKGLIAYVEKYAEVTGGADVSGLTPEIAECLVAGYKELASGADVSLLKPDEIVAYVSGYAEQQGVDISALSPEGLTAFVMAYEEATGGALTTALSPDDVTAMVAKYLQAENVDLSALTPDQIEAIVTRYAEATGCDKSQLLPSFTAYITEYKEAEGVSVPKPKTQVIITGYDYLAYRQLQNNPDLTLELPVRLGELPDGELDRLMADGKALQFQRCAGCGTLLPMGSVSRKYCSHACYIRHRFGRENHA